MSGLGPLVLRRFQRLALPALTALVLCSCRVPSWWRAPPRPQEVAARRLVGHVEALLRARDVLGIANHLTLRCRVACPGFVPMVQRREAHRLSGQWWPRLQEGSLLHDLAAVIRSYDELRAVELRSLKLAVYGREVRVRAALRIEGTAEADEKIVQSDRGVVDLVLIDGASGWRIDSLKPALVERVLTVQAVASQPTSQAADVEDDDAPEPPVGEGEASDDEAPPAPTAGPLKLSLTVDARRARVTLGSLAGKRATVVLVHGGTRCASCASLCAAIGGAIRERAGTAKGVALSLDGEVAPGCSLPACSATAETRAALASLRPLTPAVALLDGEGRTVRMWSGALEPALLDAELDRLVK